MCFVGRRGGETLDITYDLTREDYIEYYSYVNHKKGKLAIFNIVFMLIVLFWVLIFVNHNGFDIVGSFFVILIAIALYFLTARIGFTLALTNNGSMIREHFVSIGQQGLTEKIRHRTTIIEWGGVKDVIDYKHSIYFLLDNGDASIVPKRAFSNPEAALKFLRLATTYWTGVE